MQRQGCQLYLDVCNLIKQSALEVVSRLFVVVGEQENVKWAQQIYNRKGCVGHCTAPLPTPIAAKYSHSLQWHLNTALHALNRAIINFTSQYCMARRPENDQGGSGEILEAALILLAHNRVAIHVGLGRVEECCIELCPSDLHSQ